jgi:type IV fimbrial biogenesis protein FimT
MKRVFGQRRLLMKGCRNENGFTLIEMITTIAVLGIVLTIAAFSFKDVIWRNQVNVAANEFVTILSFARSEAVTRGQVVWVCRSSDGNTCNTPAGGWEAGYIVFADANGNDTCENDELLRVAAGPGGGVTMGGNGGVANSIRYAATGFLSGGAGNGTVQIVHPSKTINVVLSRNGRVRTVVQ